MVFGRKSVSPCNFEQIQGVLINYEPFLSNFENFVILSTKIPPCRKITTSYFSELKICQLSNMTNFSFFYKIGTLLTLISKPFDDAAEGKCMKEIVPLKMLFFCREIPLQFR